MSDNFMKRIFKTINEDSETKEKIEKAVGNLIDSVKQSDTKEKIDNAVGTLIDSVKDQVQSVMESDKFKEAIQKDLVTAHIKSVVETKLNNYKNNTKSQETDSEAEDKKEDSKNNSDGTKSRFETLQDYVLSTLSDIDKQELKEYENIDKLLYKYRKYEDIPKVHIDTKDNQRKICYFAVSKENSVEIINNQALKVNTETYEYIENIHCNDNEVILAVELDASRMLDLTRQSDYEKRFKLKTMVGTSLLKIVASNRPFSNYVIKYIVLDNRCVKNIIAIENNIS